MHPTNSNIGWVEKRNPTPHLRIALQNSSINQLIHYFVLNFVLLQKKDNTIII